MGFHLYNLFCPPLYIAIKECMVILYHQIIRLQLLEKLTIFRAFTSIWDMQSSSQGSGSTCKDWFPCDALRDQLMIWLWRKQKYSRDKPQKKQCTHRSSRCAALTLYQRKIIEISNTLISVLFPCLGVPPISVSVDFYCCCFKLVISASSLQHIVWAKNVRKGVQKI